MEQIPAGIMMLILFVVIIFGLWLGVMWIILPIYIIRMKDALSKLVDMQRKFNQHYKIK